MRSVKRGCTGDPWLTACGSVSRADPLIIPRCAEALISLWCREPVSASHTQPSLSLSPLSALNRKPQPQGRVLAPRPRDWRHHGAHGPRADVADGPAELADWVSAQRLQGAAAGG
jgi:hypothetical protein